MSYGFNSDKSKFPLGAASDLPDPTKTPMKIIGELQKQIIDSASIENGSTASKAYASGDYVCFQGALCKASKAISQGDTLSIGDSANDNLTLTDAAAEFARINSNLSATNNIAVTAKSVTDHVKHVAFDGTLSGGNATNLALSGVLPFTLGTSYVPIQGVSQNTGQSYNFYLQKDDNTLRYAETVPAGHYFFDTYIYSS